MTTTPQSTDSRHDMTDSLHCFGSHFRYWRERRGCTLKEAATGIMSTSNLSRFEQDKQTLDINKLAQLLMNIGVDLADFMMDYKGLRMESYAHLTLSNQTDDIPRYYQDFPDQLKLADYFDHWRRKCMLLSAEPMPELSDHIIKELLSKAVANTLEQEVITSLIAEETIPDAYIQLLINWVKNHWEDKALTESSNYPVTLTNAIKLSTVTAQSLSNMGYHKESLSLIAYTLRKINTIPQYFLQYLIIDSLNLRMIEVYTLIRMDKRTEAFKKRQELTKQLSALINATNWLNQVKLLVSMNSIFENTCNNLISGKMK